MLNVSHFRKFISSLSPGTSTHRKTTNRILNDRHVSFCQKPFRFVQRFSFRNQNKTKWNRFSPRTFLFLSENSRWTNVDFFSSGHVCRSISKNMFSMFFRTRNSENESFLIWKRLFVKIFSFRSDLSIELRKFS